MKKFASKILLFVCVFLFMSVGTLYLETMIIKSKANFRLAGNIKYVVFGHSHAECAMNDSIIQGLKNLSSSGDSYFYIYGKAKEVLQQNSKINTVFIELSNNQADTLINEWIWDADHLPAKYPKYSPFMSFGQAALLFYHNPGIFPKAFSLAIRDDLLIILRHNYNYVNSDRLGGYSFLIRDKTDSMLTASRTHLPIIHKSELPIENLEYLKKTIALCQKPGRKVYLLRVPVNSKWEYLSNEPILRKVISDDCRGIEFLDFKDFPLATNEYGDLEHLNYRGARKFSAFFSSLLQHGLLDSDNKQVVIDRAMKLTVE